MDGLIVQLRIPRSPPPAQWKEELEKEKEGIRKAVLYLLLSKTPLILPDPKGQYWIIFACALSS